LGYKITPLEGYRFHRKAKIFNDFVDPLYKLKQTKDPVQRSIAKLLLNSLYGMFGYTASDDIKLNVISNNEYFNSHSNSSDLKEVSNTLIKPSLGSKATFTFNTNVAIASAISSYARIFMSEYRNKAMYHDTDSIIVPQPLSENLVDNSELGKFKLEHEIVYGIFSANKTYGVYTKEGKTKIAAAGFNSSLLTLTDLINNLISSPVKKSHEVLIKDPKKLLVFSVTLDKELSKQYNSRFKVYIQYLENNEQKTV